MFSQWLEILGGWSRHGCASTHELAVFVRTKAQEEMVQARDWYEEKAAGLGQVFLDEFATAMRRLEADPQRAQLYYRRFRHVLFRRFPYKIFYQELEDRRVVVFRVLHAKQAHQRKLPR